MNAIQMQEEIEYSEAARHDRFDGFDRGDTDFDEGPYATTVVVARQRCFDGRRLVLDRTDFRNGCDPWFTLRFEDSAPLYAGDDEAKARTIARWWLNGAHA